MAMNGTNLGTEIKNAIAALSSADQANPTTCWQAIGAAIVAHIQTNATVTIKTTDGGLQTSQTAGSATTAPGTNKTLPGGCIG